MGSSASAHTYVETEVPNFKPGDRVSGVIKIYVEEPVSATYLHLVLIGKEKTRWTEERRRRSILSNRNEYYTATLKGEKKFLELSFPIWNFGDHLDKGQYTIPFGVQLPNWLPPSFRYEEGYLKGEVLYKFKAVIHNTDKVKSHKNVIWAKSLLHPSHPIKQVSGRETFFIRNCCCFSAGVTEASAHIHKNVATLEDNMSASILVNNTNGRQTVTGISCRLVRSLRLKNDDSSKTFEHTLLQSDEVVQIKPGESILPDKYHTLGVWFKEAKELWLTPTNKSILVNCEYSIDIVLTFDNFCGCGDYRVRLPVEVFNGDLIPNVYLTPQPELPTQWNPVALASAPIESHAEVHAPEDYFREREGYTPREY
jgi:hypothetical protein